ncbi:MAG TPA: hypothetical protein DC054_26490 [Blastocatellia bacterium]|nr:hypothetical protein [Blastocatellia bacterium]
MIFGAWLIAASAHVLMGASYRGITPLKSTREDVGRLIGTTIKPDARGAVHDFGTETAYFTFSGASPFPDGCPLQVSPGTVLQIDIDPKTEMTVGDLHLQQDRLMIFDATVPPEPGNKGYVDETEGIVVNSLNGKVLRIVYFAAPKDQAICPAYYSDPRRFILRISCILCPTIAVDAPDQVEAGSQAVFTTHIATGSPPPKLTFRWTVSDGRIIDGQDTASIVVDTKNLEGKTIRATVEVGGIDSACASKASADAKVVKHPEN